MCGRKVVSVVEMKHGAIVDWVREIERASTARGQGAIDRENLSRVIMTDLPVEPKIVPLAGKTHVVIAIQPAFDGATIAPGRNRGERRPLAGLAFLATEASAHAADFDGNRVSGFV